MTRKHFFLIGAAALLAAVATLPVAAQDAAGPVKVLPQVAEPLSPDAVDPNSIKGEDWTFDFQFEQLRPIVVTTPGGEKEVYWYLVYTITNRAEEEKYCVPKFTLFSNTTAVRSAGVYPTVFEAIKGLRKIRFLENAVQMVGKVLPGEDNARTGVAIFGPLDRSTDHFTIFVEGLSGRYIERPLPNAPADAAEDAKVVRLRKTLALAYKLPGDKWWLNQDNALFVSKAWTWR
jgi:hypothetical protein